MNCEFIKIFLLEFISRAVEHMPDAAVPFAFQVLLSLNGIRNVKCRIQSKTE